MATSKEAGTSPDGGGEGFKAPETGRPGDRAPLIPISLAERQARAHDETRRTKMAVEAARQEALHRVSASRAPDGTPSVHLDITRETRADDELDLFHCLIKTEDGTEVSLQEALGADGIEIVLGGDDPDANHVALSKYPVTPRQRLELVSQLLVAKAERMESGRQTNDDRALIAAHTAREELLQVMSTARKDAHTKDEVKYASILGAEAKYLGTLKKAHEAMERALATASSEMKVKTGQDLEGLLGLTEPQMKALLKHKLQADSLQVTAPWERKIEGYENRATGDIEHPSFLTKEGWGDYTHMFWSSREIGQHAKLMHKLGYTPGRVWGISKKSAGIVGAGGLLAGAGIGLVVRSLWKSGPEVGMHYGFRGLAKMVGGGLDALGIPHKWLTDIGKTPPWKARGEPMFGPIVRLWKAARHGEAYNKYGPDPDGKGKKKE